MVSNHGQKAHHNYCSFGYLLCLVIYSSILKQTTTFLARQNFTHAYLYLCMCVCILLLCFSVFLLRVYLRWWLAMVYCGAFNSITFGSGWPGNKWCLWLSIRGDIIIFVVQTFFKKVFRVRLVTNYHIKMQVYYLCHVYVGVVVLRNRIPMHLEYTFLGVFCFL